MFRIDSTDRTDLGINTIKVLDDGELYYMKEYKEKLLQLDTKNYNYIIFEEDINNMVYDEFKQYWDTDFIDILEFFDRYLAIDVDVIINHWEDNLTQNKTFLKDIIKFLSTILPYTYLREMLHDKNLDGFHDVLDFISNNSMKDALIVYLDKQSKEQDNFYKLMDNVEENITNRAKKSKFQNSLEILNSKINEKKKVLDYYRSILANSGEENIKELLKLYIKNDTHNIL